MTLVDELPPNLADRIDVAGSCWLWLGSKDKSGYGWAYPPRGLGLPKKMRAHRAIWELLVGPIPPGLVLDHLCRVKSCVNPDHLEPVSHSENSRRGITGMHLKMRTHCPQGHLYLENAYEVPSRPGVRYCQACNRERSRLRRALGWTG
jgi:hypothetical protein